MTADDAAATGFNRTGLTILIVVGIASAALFAFLTAYAPTLDPGQRSGAHAMSSGGTGFSALVTLTRASGTPVRLSRDAGPVGTAGLLVLTPPADADAAELARLVRARGGRPTLVILPKWATTPLPLHPGWIEQHGTVAVPQLPLKVLAPEITVVTRAAKPGERFTAAAIRGAIFPAPAIVQSLQGVGLDAVIVAADGNPVLAWQSKHDVFVLADPDVLDNAAMHDLGTARAAVALLRDLGGARDGGIVFDVTLNGIGGSRDLLRLALEPPFLGLTLALLATAALAVWQASIRFGTPIAAPRGIAPGKRALVDNITALIATARREGAMAPRYATLVGTAVAAQRHAPAGLTPDALGDWLDRDGSARFGVLAHEASLVETPAAALASARALYLWQQDSLHDRR